nr:hypothetical protein [Candidatus Sigynarchaeota archaeon]
MTVNGYNTRSIQVAFLTAGGCVVASGVYLLLVLASAVATEGVTFVLGDLAPAWLWMSGVLTCTYLAIWFRNRRHRSARKTIAHILVMNLLIIPA